MGHDFLDFFRDGWGRSSVGRIHSGLIGVFGLALALALAVAVAARCETER